MKKPILYYNINNKNERVSFEEALLKGLGSDHGLYMIDRKDIPKIKISEITEMKGLSYAAIALKVLGRFLDAEIPKSELAALVNGAYDEKLIPTRIQNVVGLTYIMWLSAGPTYSFKDYAARFFARALNYFLKKNNSRKTVLTATSGDTGGAIADALYGLSSVQNIVFFPRSSVSISQRRQMTTLKGNIFAFEVNGDFDLCQALVKNLLTSDPLRLTSANSISLGRLLPQAVYPFYAYSKIANSGEDMIASIPSGNFGDMMGTVIAREMGLPVAKIICAVNENREFPRFLATGKFLIEPTKKSPSSAMMISNPSNLARLIDLYGGYMRDSKVLKMPNLGAMREDISSYSVNNKEHALAIKDVYGKYKIILDPHGAVGWQALETYLEGNHNQLAVLYETADPGKFPEYIRETLGFDPPIPLGIKRESSLKERIFSIDSEPEESNSGIKLSSKQLKEAKEKITSLIQQ